MRQSETTRSSAATRSTRLYFLGLATDYDGTIASHGFVDIQTLEALKRLKASGRRLILVTGREMESLRHAFSDLDIFDRVVAENGALIYDPATHRELAIAPPPSARFVEELMRRNVEPISVGRSVVATWEPHEDTVLHVIRELGLELQITFNKGAVMVLPPGINKASGLRAALVDMDLSIHNVVAVGDAENDHAFLRACGCAAAVANALPALKQQADIQLSRDHGAGVVELVNRMISEDVRLVPLSRKGIPIGTDRGEQEVHVGPDRGVLVAGAPLSGKSRFATAFTERLVDKQLEFCIFDPEGDHEKLKHAVNVGDASTPPSVAEIQSLLRDAGINVVVNTLALDLPQRQRLFADLTPFILDLRAATGRPHWVLIEEAHHFVPARNGAVSAAPSRELRATIFITIRPDLLSRAALETIDTILAFGSNAPRLVAEFASALQVPAPTDIPKPSDDEIVCWSRSAQQPPRIVTISPPQQPHRRHRGKYFSGDVGDEESFWFRGPANRINLRARNLQEFLRLAEQVDDAVWEHHLRAGDYSTWFRESLKDEALAREATLIEGERGIDPHGSRKRLRDAVCRRYLA